MNKDSHKALVPHITPQHVAKCSVSAARKCISRDTAEKLLVLPLTVQGSSECQKMLIAASRDDADLAKSLTFSTGIPVKIVPVEAGILKEAIHIAYCGDENAIKPIQKNTYEIMTSSQPYLSSFKGEGPAAELVASLLEYCIAHAATDLHLFPEKDAGYARLRLTGRTLTNQSRICDAHYYGIIVKRLKILSSLDITQHNQPQEGRITIPWGAKELYGRISIMPTIFGEKVVIRFSGNGGILNLNQLSMSQKLFQVFQDITVLKEGLVLLCGSTGSGKTTSLYALLERCAQSGRHIISIEDPVERIVPWMSQTSVGPQLSYLDAFKGALRQDIDIVLLGEIRDASVAQEVVRASLSGHLIFSSFHAGSVQQTIERLFSLGVPREQTYEALQCVIVQELLPAQCEACKVYNLKTSRKEKRRVYSAPGCSACNEGERGVSINAQCAWREKNGTLKEILSKEESLSILLDEGKISVHTFNQHHEQSPV